MEQEFSTQSVSVVDIDNDLSIFLLKQLKSDSSCGWMRVSWTQKAKLSSEFVPLKMWHAPDWLYAGDLSLTAGKQ